MEHVPLTFNERRVLGVLVEKGFTTPEQYPLTLNALVAGSNQKSCRNPVTRLEEEDVAAALDGLRRKGLCALVQPIGGRTDRWRHLATDALSVSAPEAAVLAELLLRGPQTDGELRQNSRRMAPIESLDGLAQLIEGLRRRDPPLVVRLGPEERRRGVRYAHALYPPEELREVQEREAQGAAAETPGSAAAPPRPPAVAPELDGIRAELAALRQRIERIERELGVGGATSSPGPSS
jgi:hypothetical protein